MRPVDLANDLEFQVDCERCGRPFDLYDTWRNDAGLRVFHRRGQEGKDWMHGPGRLQERGGSVTGRHRARSVLGRDGRRLASASSAGVATSGRSVLLRSK
jgi:hypothetical protein